MLLKKAWSKNQMHCYEVTQMKRIVLDVNQDNSIKTVTMIDWNKEFPECRNEYSLSGLYYIENLTPEDHGEIDQIDSDKLIHMLMFDEMECA